MELPVLTFLLVSFLIGLHAVRRVDGKVRNFYVGGNIIPFWVLALSLAGQAVEMGGSLDNANETMVSGFWGGALLPVGIGLSLLLLGFFYAGPLNRMKLLTLPDYYKRRFDERSELLTSLLCLVSFVLLIAGNLAGIGKLLEHGFGLPLPVGSAAVAVLVMTYTIAGGLFAVTWNDVLHLGVVLLGFAALLIWMLGYEAPLAQGAVDHAVDSATGFEPFLGAQAIDNWADLLALALGDVVALDFMERVFAAKTPRAARHSCLIAGSITIVIGLIIAFIGVVTFELLGGLCECAGACTCDVSFLRVLGFLEDEGFTGIAMMVQLALIAACISTVDGALMACANVIMRNLVLRWHPRAVSRERVLPLSRLSLVPVTVLAIAVSIAVPNPKDLLLLAFDVVFAGCFVPLTLGLFWRRATARASLWAIAVPSVVRLLAYVIRPSEPPWPEGLDTLVPPLLSLVILVVISLRHPPSPRGHGG